MGSFTSKGEKNFNRHGTWRKHGPDLDSFSTHLFLSDNLVKATSILLLNISVGGSAKPKETEQA
jgi:hypothetical protein